MDVSIREAGWYRFGSFRLDPVRRALLCDGQRVKLAERLFDTLLYLVANHGRLVERDELLAAVWGNRVVEDNNLAQAIFTLRKVLRSFGATETFIVTAPARGYRFAAPVVFEPEILEPLADTAPQAPVPPEAAVRPVRVWHGRISLGVALLALVLAVVSIILMRAPPGHFAAPAPAFAPPARSVAVLAFVNMSGDPGQDYFADGLSEQLIDSLARIDALHVAARTSSFAFRGSHATVGEIARKLDVGAVLEGSVRRQGGRVLITAQLINALTGYHYWSRTYDRTNADILDLQGEIARAVTQSLQVTLLGNEAARLALGGTANPAALDAYLRGVKLQSAATAAGLRAALAQYDTALALDGGYARARTARAFALAYLGEIGAITDPVALRGVFTDALAEADRAVALAPTLGAAHSVRGLVLAWGFLDAEGDAAEQARARELTPGSATIEGNYADAQVSLGHFDEAIAAERTALQLDPMAPDRWGGLARALYMARRYDEAADALHHATTVAETLPARILFVLGNVELMRGHPEAARQACAAAADWKESQILAIAYHALGRQTDAEAELARVRAKLGDAGAYNYAVIDAQWGRNAEALRWLAVAARLRDPGLADIRVNPMLDPIRNTPQFGAIEATLKATSKP